MTIISLLKIFEVFLGLQRERESVGEGTGLLKYIEYFTLYTTIIVFGLSF